MTLKAGRGGTVHRHHHPQYTIQHNWSSLPSGWCACSWVRLRKSPTNLGILYVSLQFSFDFVSFEHHLSFVYFISNTNHMSQWLSQSTVVFQRFHFYRHCVNKKNQYRKHDAILTNTSQARICDPHVERTIDDRQMGASVAWRLLCSQHTHA